MFHYTYMTVDENSGKYYVGRHSTKNLFDDYKGSGKWVRNYPKIDRHKLTTYILEFFNTADDLKIGEQALLNEYFQKPLNMNFNNRAEGFAIGEHNPTNLLTPEQKQSRSDNHWTKTEEGSRFVSENNPSKLDHVKILRSTSAKELWLIPEYREKYTGDNHWVNQDSDSAKAFHERMTSEANPAKRPEVKEILRQKSKAMSQTDKFVLTDPHIQELAIIGLRNRFKSRRDSGLSSFSEEHLKNLAKPKKLKVCPHCGLEGGAGNMTRYHFDNCKVAINNIDEPNSDKL